jgi:hypothetical protein
VVGTRIMDLPTGKITFEDGNLAERFSNEVGISMSNVVTNNGTNALTMKFKPTTGTFSGSVAIPGTNVVIKFGGVVSQGIPVGVGHFIGQTQSGNVVLSN